MDNQRFQKQTMKIIINTSTLSASGVTQVTTSFLNECKQFTDNFYYVFLSDTVEKQIRKEDFPGNFFFYSFNAHPLYGLSGYRVRKRQRLLEREIDPDVVFSVFGPSWWTPKAPHLQGYAYPHYVYPKSPLFAKLSSIQRLKIWFLKKIHLYALNKNGDFFVSETNDVTSRLKKLLKNSKNNFYTVGNTCSAFFYDFLDKGPNAAVLPQKMKNEFRFLSLCTYHLHKNLEILNKVIPLLNSRLPENQIKFVLTIDDNNFNKKFSEQAKQSIINVGRVSVQKCPQLFSECDALFLPTLLECFSANYPEAMIMHKPILTSSLSFATTVCDDAGLYFNPLDEYDIVDKIIEIYQNKDLCELLVKNGEKRLADFPKAAERAKKYLTICKEIYEQSI